MSFSAIDWSELSLQVMITFAHFLWQAFFVSILLVIGEQALKTISGRARALRSFAATPDGWRRSANVRYMFACIAFFSLPLCVIATFAGVHQSRGPILLATSNASVPIMSPAVFPAEPASALKGIEVSALPSAEMPADTTNARIGSTHPETRWYDRFQVFAPYLLVAYTIGVGLMLARFGMSIVSSSRLRRTLQPITDSNLVKIIAEQSSRLGLRRLPIVALCERVSVPVVVGIVKPMILLPPALLCGLDPHQLPAILSHEMAHIRRYDLVVNLLQRIVEAFLFFHPVTWWVSRRIRIERENCCDDLAAADCGRFGTVKNGRALRRDSQIEDHSTTGIARRRWWQYIAARVSHQATVGRRPIAANFSDSRPHRSDRTCGRLWRTVDSRGRSIGWERSNGQPTNRVRKAC